MDKSIRTRTLLLLFLAVLGSSPDLRAQGGGLTPPGSPAPAMRSLQEIWDTLGALDATVTAQQQQIITQGQKITTQGRQITSLQQDSVALGLLLEDAGITLPWQITTVDSAGTVGTYTSLAFTPAGQPAISYYDITNTNLKYAVRAPFVSP